MPISTFESLDILAQDVDAVVSVHHHGASDIAKAYVVGILGLYARTEDFSYQNSASPRKGFLSVVEMRQWCIDHPLGFKELGDYCLLSSGLFHERAERRGFSEYHEQVGSEAYYRYGRLVASLGHSDPLYDELSSDFDKWEKVLGVVSAQAMSDSRLLEVLERYMHKPANPHYAAILQAKGIPLVIADS